MIAAHLLNGGACRCCPGSAHPEHATPLFSLFAPAYRPPRLPPDLGAIGADGETGDRRRFRAPRRGVTPHRRQFADLPAGGGLRWRRPKFSLFLQPAAAD